MQDIRKPETDLAEAMKFFAAGHDPITEAGQIPDKWKKRIVCVPMDAEWKQRVNTHNWALAYDGTDPLDQGMLKLRDRLLSFGGEEACMAFEEPDLDELLRYGQLWNGWSNVRVKKGRRCGCHENSARLVKADETDSLAVATGYALSDDGMWRQHSWVVTTNQKGTQVVETTGRRLLYFGVVLAGEKLESFIEMNY